MIPESISGTIFSPDRKQILLIQRRDVPVWVLPGGGIDPNEMPEEALVREMLEETGFHVKIERLIGTYQPINRLTKKTFLYECLILSGQMSLSSETRDIRFFSLNDLPPMPPPYLEWVTDALQGGPTVHKSLTSVTYSTLAKLALLHPLLVLRFLLSRLGVPFNSH